MKKKIIVVLVIMIGFTDFAFSQFEEYFREKSNVVFFSGLVFKQDSEQKGSYLGTYLDYQVFKSDNGKWTISPYGVISRSSSNWIHSELNMSESKSYAYGLGFSSGYYEQNFSFRHQLFAGFSLGIKYEEEEVVASDPNGEYVGVQKDFMLKTGLNLNILKSFGLREDLFTRSQVQMSFLVPLNSKKVGVWNNYNAESEYINTGGAWNKKYFELQARQNIIKVPIDYMQNYYFSPKLVGFYSFSAGDNRHFYGLGTEFAFHRAYRDDFLTLGALYKISRRMTDNYFILSLNFNLSSLLRKY